MMKNYSLEIIDGLICSVFFMTAALLGPAISLTAIYICCALFGIYFLWRVLCYNFIKPFLVFLVSGALFTIIGYALIHVLPVFYYIFTSFHPGYGKPSAGTGLGVVVSFYFNTKICIAAAVIGFIKIMIKNGIASKKQME